MRGDIAFYPPYNVLKDSGLKVMALTGYQRERKYVTVYVKKGGV
jgi:hypothetical protein